jgi:ADP-ribose pyrophosphatase YjhB (NUDIX family)
MSHRDGRCNIQNVVCYTDSMETKVLIVGVVMKGDAILMRKKPDGSPPYTETWYIFGAVATAQESTEDAIKNEVRIKAGVEISVVNKISWDTEVKKDLDGVEKFFVYLDVLCEYKGGELTAPPDVEKLEWVHKADLSSYDIVPLSRVLFEKLGLI